MDKASTCRSWKVRHLGDNVWVRFGQKLPVMAGLSRAVDTLDGERSIAVIVEEASKVRSLKKDVLEMARIRHESRAYLEVIAQVGHLDEQLPASPHRANPRALGHGFVKLVSCRKQGTTRAPKLASSAICEIGQRRFRGRRAAEEGWACICTWPHVVRPSWLGVVNNGKVGRRSPRVPLCLAAVFIIFLILLIATIASRVVVMLDATGLGVLVFVARSIQVSCVVVP